MKSDFVNIHTHRPTRRAVEPAFEGVHPWESESEGAEDFLAALEARLEAAAAGKCPRVEMIGETGLDFACRSDRRRQVELFRRHLELAERFGVPVVLHTVRSFEETMRELGRYRLRAVIFHGFIGSPQQALRAVAEGYYLSFGERSLTSPRSVESLKSIPSDRLFLETDDSETPIEEIYTRACEILGRDPEELRRTIMSNYEDIFSK